MQALGLIETKGLIVAIESADAMLKAANVSLIEKTYVGGGLVSIAVTGEVGAVKAAVEAGEAAVKKINQEMLVSQHVIPRPHEELDGVIFSIKPKENIPIETSDSIKVEPVPFIPELPVIIEESTEPLELDLDHIDKMTIDKIAKESGIDKAIEILDGLKVTKLRNLAREYKSFGIAGRLISKADKKKLLAEFKVHYKVNNELIDN